MERKENFVDGAHWKAIMRKQHPLMREGTWATLVLLFAVVTAALSSVVMGSVGSPVYHNRTHYHTLPRPNPVYTAAELDLLRAHFQCFLHLKAAEPLVHILPKTNILFQIVSPAPRHLGRYCGRGSGARGAVEAEIDVIDMFGQEAPRSLGEEGGGAFIVDIGSNRRLFPGEKAMLQRIPENEVWRVYYPSSTRARNSSGVVAENATYEVLTEVISVKKVWANRVPREICRNALAEELGYDPYNRDAMVREEQPGLGIGLQPYTYPLPGEEEITEGVDRC